MSLTHSRDCARPASSPRGSCRLSASQHHAKNHHLIPGTLYPATGSQSNRPRSKATKAYSSTPVCQPNRHIPTPLPISQLYYLNSRRLSEDRKGSENQSDTYTQTAKSYSAPSLRAAFPDISPDTAYALTTPLPIATSNLQQNARGKQSRDPRPQQCCTPASLLNTGTM
jgi:hypothetical protein